ncbi:class I fructose-bisphosphate aldolase [Hymenobacter caeli]|uniref:Fructose-bisphosphate aldolase n=1 Tax=Hymenobacter caeli TaxID=2735894 RepID=A0ABX2FUM1_9BACT|nr:class I fructose-bisphosphate aldolase [Hymenobacter caeli]NRT20184.1 hypothetical protein [Hymenobacter caeli]
MEPSIPVPANLAKSAEHTARYAAVLGAPLPARLALLHLAMYPGLLDPELVAAAAEPAVHREAETIAGPRAPAGPHSLARCAAVTEEVHKVFAQLRTQGVAQEGLLLKPGMVPAGPDCPRQPTTAQVADATLACLRRMVPAAVPGVAFLSGGQSPEQATRHPAAMRARGGPLPWALTFSIGRARARHQPALETWAGQAANVAAAQRALLHRVASNRAAVGAGQLPGVAAHP